VIASPDDSIVRSLSPSVRANPQIPDFFGEPQANSAMVECLVKAGLSIKLLPYIEEAHEMSLLAWRCEITDRRAASGDFHRTFIEDALDRDDALCAAVCDYLKE
jgi:hypothetical protein